MIILLIFTHASDDKLLQDAFREALRQKPEYKSKALRIVTETASEIAA